MATDFTTTTTLEELVPEIVAEVLIVLQTRAGILDTVRIKNTSGQPGLVCDFPTYTEVTSSEVETPGEKTATTNVIDLETNTHQATITEKVIVARISDLATKYTTDDLVEAASTLFSSAIMAKLEDDIVNLFSGFDLTGVTAGSTFAETHIWDAIRQLKAANADVNNLVGVISPKQYYGEKGLRKLIVTLNLESGAIGEEMKNRGFVSNACGIDWYVSNEIDEDVSSGGDAAGAIYQRGAIGLHTKDLFKVEVARGSTAAEARYDSLICVGEWGVIEIMGTWGVYEISDVS